MELEDAAFILAGMGRAEPGWLPEAREFCHRSGIKIMAWGPDLLTVEAKTPARADEIVAQFAILGFEKIDDAGDSEAGMLSLSKDPDAVQAKIANFDISRRRWDERVEPLIWAGCATVLLYSGLKGTTHYRGLTIGFGLLMLLCFIWDGLRVWGWKTQLTDDCLRIRRSYRWRTIRWCDCRDVESVPSRAGSLRSRNQELVVVVLASGARIELGSFGAAFARNLRDRLRLELSSRAKAATNSDRS